MSGKLSGEVKPQHQPVVVATGSQMLAGQDLCLHTPTDQVLNHLRLSS